MHCSLDVYVPAFSIKIYINNSTSSRSRLFLLYRNYNVSENRNILDEYWIHVKLTLCKRSLGRHENNYLDRTKGTLIDAGREMS